MPSTGLPINLDDLIHERSVESSRLEFKATWNEIIDDSAVRTVCAFANDFLSLNGGYVILGVEADDLGHPMLPPKGLDELNLDRLQLAVRVACHKIAPDYLPVLFPEIYQGRSILVLWAPAGDNRPYEAPKRGSRDKGYFIRVGAETIEATGELQRQLIEQAARVPFDDRRSLSATITDVSFLLVEKFLTDVRSDLARDARTMDPTDLYRRLRLTVPINAHDVPKNIALLFFVNDPEQFFRGARVEIAQFADDAGGNLIEERIIRGPLPDQIKLTLDYLNGMTDVVLRKVPGQAEVDRMVAYPYEAMEEAIVNAVYHRSYEGTPDPVKVYLYPDRMEITSYPGPVRGIQSEHLQAGGQVPPVPARNRRIGELLKELRLAEARGTGLPKIRRQMMENGSPEPHFDFDEDRTYFRVILPAHPRYQMLHALRESALLWTTGDRPAAIAHLRRLSETNAGSGAIARQLIEYAFTVGDLALAQTVFERFRGTPIRTETSGPYLQYASGLLDRGLNKEAAQILELIPPAGPATDIAEAAILRKRMGNYREAHRLFVQVLPELRDDARIVHEFAQTKLSLARAERDPTVKQRLNREAVEMLHRAIQLSTDPVRQAWCWFELARTLNWLKEPRTQVEEAYLRTLALRPEEPRFREGYERWKSRV